MLSQRTTRVEYVRGLLLAMLTSGEYGPGDQLPNEHELSERFNVSRATTREAYSALIDMGYLVRKHGTGTFVSLAPRKHSLELNLSYTELISAAGFRANISVVSQEIRAATHDDQQQLRLSPSDLVLVVERIRYADDRPVVYSVDRLPLRLVPVDQHAKASPSLFSMLAKAGHAATSGRTRLLPVTADTELAGFLRVSAGTPLLKFEQVDYNQEGQPVLASTEWHTSDVFEMWINRRATFPSEQ